MNTHKTILSVIIFIFCHATTFSMDQPKHQNNVIAGTPNQLPPINFYPVSNRDDLLQIRMPNRNEDLFPYPFLSNDFVRKEPYCMPWYNAAFEKAAQLNVTILRMQNASHETFNRYFRRLMAERELMLSLAESAFSDAMPAFFHPQFHIVDSDEELRSHFSASNHGFYFYPRPAHTSLDVNILKNVYKATLKLNINRAYYLELPLNWIERHIKIVLSLEERYQYDLEYATLHDIKKDS